MTSFHGYVLLDLTKGYMSQHPAFLCQLLSGGGGAQEGNARSWELQFLDLEKDYTTHLCIWRKIECIFLGRINTRDPN
jgi:hypothetical protein